jgi:ABC-2 type transport system permease protein
MMFREILIFEVSYQLRRGSTWICFVVIFSLLLVLLKEMVQYAINVEQVLINSPITVAEITSFASKFSLLLIPALVADGATRDIQKRMDQLIYATPVSKMSYLGGRVCGTLFVATTLMLLVLLLTVISANLVMVTDPAVVGPFHAAALVDASVFLIIPNVIIATLFLYGITWLTRHAMAAYAGALIIFILSTFSMEVLGGQWSIAKLLDPFAGTIVDAFSLTLLLKDRNVARVPVDGYLLANRLIWIVIAISVVWPAVLNFRLAYSLPRTRLKEQETEESIATRTPIRITTPYRPFTFKMKLFQALITAFRLYKEIVFSAGGSLIVAIAVYAVVLIPNLSEGPMGVSILPTTDRMLSFMDSTALQIFVALLISLYAGQLIWRERDTRMSEIVDAAPISNGWMLTIKYLAVLGLVMTIQFALLLSGIIIQIINDYGHFQLALYLSTLFGFQLVQLLMFAAVAMVLHVLVNHKYVGHLTIILFYFYTLLGPRFGLEHKLFVFGSHVGLPTSVFHDLSVYLFPWMLFKSYWLGWTILLWLTAVLLWVRGPENGWRSRIRKAYFSTVSKLQVSIAVLLILVAGGMIYYNTNVRNEYQTNNNRVLMRVDFEQKYGRYRYAVQPHLTATKLMVDFFPERRSADVSGIYSLKNLSDRMIDSIHVVVSDEVITSDITFDTKWTVLISDSLLNYHLYLLDDPLKPGDSIQMNFRLNYAPTGFSNRGIPTAVMKDGTYFSSRDWLPSVGYRPDREITDHGARTKYGLPQRTVRDLRDGAAVMDLAGREQIAFDLVASTTPGQTVVAPGSLKNTWTENGRTFFHYVADSPIRNIYHVYSAHYAVRQTKWNDVPLFIYHRLNDTLNLKTMEASMKASLAYYTANFSPYNSTALKLVQYADPGTGGISLPGTIGYSTNFARLNSHDRRGFDLPFAVVAHEVAHQWWAHQLVPADVEGAMFLTESLSWYSALCVIRKTKGEEHLDHLLAAMRASYYGPRARADVPLLETVDPTNAYRKGPFAMYAMREYIGEERVNLALRKLLTKFTRKKLPLPTSLDFYNELKAVTPDSLSYLLKDLFAFNTIWDLKAKSVTVGRVDDHQWIVRLQFTAKKEIVDAEGKITTLSMLEPVEIGIYKITSGGQRQSIYMQKHMVRSGENIIEVKVFEQPAEAGVDPRNLLIDMDPYDNVRKAKVIQ